MDMALIIKYMPIVLIILLVVIGIAYFILMKKMGKSEYRQMKKLQEGTKADSFSKDIFYQKLIPYTMILMEL